MTTSHCNSEKAFSSEEVTLLLQALRERHPRVHCITNAVAQELTANVLLAAGAIPSMTIAAEEVAAFAASADALLVNLGTLDEDRRTAIPLAIRAAREAGRPVVLDPVFIDRSPVRAAYARELLSNDEMLPDLVKVNPGELTVLPELEDLARQGRLVLVITGATDRIVLQEDGLVLSNGTALLGRITATGCALGALIGAFAALGAATPAARMTSAAAAVSLFNLAAELAADRAAGPGSLVPGLLDGLYGLSVDEIRSRLVWAPSASSSTSTAS